MKILPKSINNINHLFWEIWNTLTRVRKRQFSLLLVLMLFSSCLEVVSLGAVIPFLGIITNPEKVWENSHIKIICNFLGISSESSLIIFLTLAFCFFALASGIMRFICLWASVRISFGAGGDAGQAAFLRTLHQPYSVHLARNSAVIIDVIYGKSQVYIGALTSILTIFNALVIVIFLSAMLIMLQPSIAATTIVVLGGIYFLIIRFAKGYLEEGGRRAAEQSILSIKTLQEGLGGIRDVILDGSQKHYSDIYKKSDSLLRRSLGSNQIFGGAPRFFLEAFGIVLLSGLAYWMAKQDQGVAGAIPMLGLFALAAQRLLPTLQQLYSSWTTLKGSDTSIQEVLKLLKQPVHEQSQSKGGSQLDLFGEIKFEDVYFSYAENEDYVLENVNISIKSGAKIGIVGSTGSGKSTFLDLLMGLLSPSRGKITIDGMQLILGENERQWQEQIAHVPQNIYLIDTSVAQNIALGCSDAELNLDKVKDAALKAEISKSIESWDDGYRTQVGERGARISGGERQRIGLARAFYKNAKLIVLDEATSALDEVTEKVVMKNVENYSANLTLVLVTHRLSTLSLCDYIFEIRDKKIIQKDISQYSLNESKKHN